MNGQDIADAGLRHILAAEARNSLKSELRRKLLALPTSDSHGQPHLFVKRQDVLELLR